MIDAKPRAPSLAVIAADIVAAYVINNKLSQSELTQLIESLYSALESIGRDTIVAPVAPAVPTNKSINKDYLICLEDGKRFKSLKRHLRATYNMSPDDYRSKWGLPHDYPMVAPNYAITRSRLAKESGLGRSRRVPS